MKGQVAVVTGGGRGIGHAIARAFAEAGGRLVLAEIDPETLERGKQALAADGYDVTGIQVDVTDAASVDSMVGAVMSGFGQVDVLVNAAGIFRVTPALDVSDAEWHAVMDVNATGLFRCARTFGKHMVARGRGSIAW